jgi:hypothetical protein
MTAFSKLAAVFAATTLALALAGDASAKTKPVKPTPAASEQTAQPPSPPPQQFIVAKGVEPLTRRSASKACGRKTVSRNATSARKWWWCQRVHS